MKFKFIFIFSILMYDLANGQLVAPQPSALRPISNINMVIQFGNQRIEVLPTKRAIKQANGHFRVSHASASDVVTEQRLGVAYSYASNTIILINGEISVLLGANYSIHALGSLAAGAKLLAPPNFYVLTATTPLDLVRIVGILQSNPAVKWAEPYIIKALITE